MINDNKPKEDEMKKTTKKTALKLVGKKHIGTPSIADKDFMAAEDLRERLENSLDKINESVCNIYEEMSGFNSPGMKKAYSDAIVKGMSKHTNMFMIDSAKRELGKYYERWTNHVERKREEV